MDKVELMVVTHCDFDDSVFRGHDEYTIVKVGQRLSDGYARQRGWLTDNTGENISQENPRYCELTALYWAWKNLHGDVTGLVHYRRFFADFHRRSKGVSDDILTAEKMTEILKTKKIILPPPSIKVKDASVLYRNRPKDKQDKHWVIMEEIMHKEYPDFMPAFNHVLYECRTTYYLNMFVIRRSLMDEYCGWLFSVLKRYDERIAAMGEERIPRVDGFLSETLLHIWVEHRLQKDDIYHCPVLHTNKMSSDYYGNSLGRTLQRMFRSSRVCMTIKSEVKLQLLILRRMVFKK